VHLTKEAAAMSRQELPRIAGAVPVLAMPFDDDGALDLDSLRREIDFCLEAGSQAIAFGIGSESATLTDAERGQAWETAARHLDGRLPLVAATAHASDQGTIALTRLARECGVDCAMVDPSPRGGDRLVGLFCDLSARVGLPLMVQDAGGNAPAPVLLRAAVEAPSVCALKIESAGPPHKIGIVVEGLREAAGALGGRQVTVLGGANGSLLLEELDRGSIGAMPHPALIDAFRGVCDGHAAGDRAGAWELYVRAILPVLRLTTAAGSANAMLALQKAAMRRAGIMRTERCRLAADPLPEWVLDRALAHLRGAGLAISSLLAGGAQG
jgi:dihydrodipicolinate synthase/N-acetylneuraminate lyase